MLTFVIPIRHQATVRDWNAVKARLETTIRSLRAQDNPQWQAVIVANRGADLPDCLQGIAVVFVDFPANSPNSAGPKEEFYEAVRHDKGHRILAGLMHVRPTGHVMVVDYDDMVSRRLASLVAENPAANGWYVDSGYFFSGGRTAYFCPYDFYEWCGTSHIVRSDLLQLPMEASVANEDYVRRTLGSHKFIKKDLEKAGTPLARLPYPGAVYRMGHSDAVSGSVSLVSLHINRWALYKPVKLLRDLSRFRYLGSQLAHEFFDGTPA